MYKQRKKKHKKTYLPNLIRPNEIRVILRTMGIEWQQHNISSLGWVVIKSPLRTDTNPSFSVNINHGGFIDFANPNIKGDIVKLVALVLECDQENAEEWIIKTLNLQSILN